MTPEQWRLISSAFHGALAQPPEGRQAFLSNACGADAGVREEVERLLRAHQNAGAFGEAPVAELSAVTVSPIAEDIPQAKSPAVFVVLTWLMAIAALAAFTTATWILVEQRGTTSWIGWDVTPRAGEWRINTVTNGGPAAGQLKIGDRLVSVNGAAPVTDAGIHFARRQLSLSTSYEVIVERDGQLRNQRLVVAGRSNTGELVYFAVSSCGVRSVCSSALLGLTHRSRASAA